MQQHHLQNLLVVVFVIMSLFVIESNQAVIDKKTYLIAYASSTGFYNINSDGGSCELSVGYIPSNNLWELKKSPYHSSKFVQLSLSKIYSSYIFLRNDDGPFNGYDIIAFNNNSIACFGTLSATRAEYNVANYEAKASIPYAGGATFNHAGTTASGPNLVNSFKITSKSANPMILGTSVDGGNTFNIIALRPNETMLVAGHEMFLRCDYMNGCSVAVSYVFFSQGILSSAISVSMLIGVLLFTLSTL